MNEHIEQGSEEWGASRLRMIEDNTGKTSEGRITALYECRCGNTITAARCRVKKGQPKSCGCLARELSSARATRHGMKLSSTYSTWSAMKDRCLNPRSKDYKRYGASGISVCERWAKSFDNFLSDMGERPDGTTLDRHPDPNSGYMPGNCRWATPKQQARNRKDLVHVSTDQGVMPLADYAVILGITRGAAHLRLKRGKLENASRI